MSERSERLFGEKLEGEAPPRTNAAIQKLAGIGDDAPRTIEELLARLPELAPDQRDAPPSRACVLRADGDIDPHIMFAWVTREEDSAAVIIGLWEALKRYVEHRTGPVYWRRRPILAQESSFELDPLGDLVVDENYSVAGPDCVFCVHPHQPGDRGRLVPVWKASCRVTRSDGTFFDTKPGLAVDPT